MPETTTSSEFAKASASVLSSLLFGLGLRLITLLLFARNFDLEGFMIDY